MKRLLLLLTILLPACFTKAQLYYFRNYQVNNGVSSNTITSITQDKKGFIWFGTRNGLNRFDGNTFRIFRNNIADSTSIGSNSILSLHEDNREQLWVGTYKGIYRYNPLSEQFSAFSKVPAGEIRFIRGDSKDNIWIVADFVLYRYNLHTTQVKQYVFDSAQTVCIHLADNGTLWAAASNGVLRKYNAATDQFTAWNLTTLHTKAPLTQIQDIFPVNDTSILVGTMNEALQFNTAANTLTNIFNDYHWKNAIQIHKILRQSDDEYWFGTESGLYIYNTRTQQATAIQKQYGNPYSITDNVIYAFYKDREGSTWIGTFFGGVNYYSRQYNRFRKYFPLANVNSLSGNLVHEICSDQQGNIWIGTEDAGVNKLDLTTGLISHYLPGKEKGSLSYRNIHGLLATGNELWIGTYEHGLDVMNIQTGKVIRHYNAGSGPNDLKSNFIVTLYQTRKGEVLVGTWSGLFKYNRQTDNFSPVPFFNTQVQAIHEDEEGTIWISTYGNGIYYYNAATGKGGNFKYQPHAANTIINNYVNNLFEDSHKNFWFCTEGGLSKYEPATGKFTSYTIENGLPDNQLFRIQEDNKGTLWISTAKGLAAFNPQTSRFDTYTTAHGLLTEQFNYNSAYKTPDGTLYFGTVKGLISFNPAAFTPGTFIPPVYITGLQVNNKDLEIGKKDAALQESITYTRHITLPYDRSNISLDVAALSYTVPQTNAYLYKMDGLEKDWTYIKTNRKIYYTKLPPGHYTFRLKGAGSGKTWNNTETTLTIRVLPPWWAGTWAWCSYIIIGAAIAFTIFRYYHMAVAEKNKRKIEALEIEKEREIYNAKIEFFTNVAHEIRTPLTLIKMPLDKLIQQQAGNFETSENLNMMKKNTNRLIDLTNQLLDFRKAEASKFSLSFVKTDINEFIEEIAGNFKPAAEQKQVAFKTSLPRLTLHAWVDAEALKKILTNLVNNAIKYAATSVSIRMLPFSSEDITFTIEVQNDGNIIPAELKEKIFEPFYRVKETEKQPGTGIGLALSRSLTELHKGTLELKQGDTQSNVFILTLPIHQEKEISLHEEEVSTDPVPAGISPVAIPASQPDKPFILLVEDNKEISGFIQKELSSSYNVLKAFNGQEALDILQKENVQLVISDIMMPVMDGIELCKKVKTDLQYSHIPIILLTAKNTLHARIEGLEVGADAYIEKPFSFEHLLAQITNLLTNRTIIKEYFARSPLTHLKGIACSAADKQFLEQLYNIINEHIANTDLDVDQLSRLMNISRPTLYRKINALSNLSPNELINLSRLKKAAELLAEGNYKINEVANMVGYSLQTNFSRDFHKQFGVSPSTYVNGLKKTV
ncbi:MAG: two-component regulator propeller domain-containing protein [Chitinophagaceae bacterium]